MNAPLPPVASTVNLPSQSPWHVGSTCPSKWILSVSGDAIVTVSTVRHRWTSRTSTRWVPFLRFVASGLFCPSGHSNENGPSPSIVTSEAFPSWVYEHVVGIISVWVTLGPSDAGTPADLEASHETWSVT